MPLSYRMHIEIDIKPLANGQWWAEIEEDAMNNICGEGDTPNKAAASAMRTAAQRLDNM